ncbi:hypothetical protein [Streptomyces sp. MT206]|uniref:hypothetical protein n=1 Tax=Streptomyces sp. MT206 TaxID=3031407 RepID=UPI002FC9E934
MSFDVSPLPPSDRAEEPSAWPQGILARYLTKAGEILLDCAATVDVGKAPNWGYRSRCRSCGHDWIGGDEALAKRDAQNHAETCRALPHPTATTGSAVVPLPGWMPSQLAHQGIDLTAPDPSDEPTTITPCGCGEGCPACGDTGVIYP